MPFIKEKAMKNGQDIFIENTLYFLLHCVEMIPFLMKETKRLERMYPQETYALGPILAIQELAVRLLD